MYILSIFLFTNNITCISASFEVRVNDELVHSKLQTMAFPDFNEVTELVKDVSRGKSINKIQKHQSIDCVIS